MSASTYTPAPDYVVASIARHYLPGFNFYSAGIWVRENEDGSRTLWGETESGYYDYIGPFFKEH